jgi:hypothetical protein
VFWIKNPHLLKHTMGVDVHYCKAAVFNDLFCFCQAIFFTGVFSFSAVWLPDGFLKAHRWRLHRRHIIEHWRMP